MKNTSLHITSISRINLTSTSSGSTDTIIIVFLLINFYIHFHFTRFEITIVLIDYYILENSNTNQLTMFTSQYLSIIFVLSLTVCFSNFIQKSFFFNLKTNLQK
jgi:hypothetical protein